MVVEGGVVVVGWVSVSNVSLVVVVALADVVIVGVVLVLVVGVGWFATMLWELLLSSVVTDEVSWVDFSSLVGAVVVMVGWLCAAVVVEVSASFSVSAMAERKTSLRSSSVLGVLACPE